MRRDNDLCPLRRRKTHTLKVPCNDALTPLLAYSVDTKLGVFRINESKAELIVAVAGLSICTSSGAREQRTHTATRQAFPDPLSGLPVADDADLYVLGIRPRRRMV